MPSLYLGCNIDDDIADALQEVNRTLMSIEKEADTKIAELKTQLDQLSGTKKYASVTLGSAPANQVKWTAVTPGAEGNDIRIAYLYRGPIYDVATTSFLARVTSVEVVGKNIYITLPVTDAGHIDPIQDINNLLPVWTDPIVNPDLVALVTGEVVGTGVGIPEAVPLTSLTGGAGTPMKDAEEAGNAIAKQFGQSNYQSLLKSVDIPIIESAADAAAYLESVDDEIVIINKKLFIVDGTNLVGIRLLYNVLNQDVKKTKDFLLQMSSNPRIPHVFVSQNLEDIRYEIVCGVPTPVSAILPIWRTYNEGLITTANRFVNGEIGELTSIILWVYQATDTSQNYTKLSNWGYSDELLDFILLGETPVLETFYGVEQIPAVEIIVEPNIFKLLRFTDAEMKELLDKDVPGIRVPKPTDADDKNDKIKEMLQQDRPFLPNGMRTKIKKPLALLSAVDTIKTGDNENLSRELAVRGRACSRQRKNAVNKKPDVLGKLDEFADVANVLGDDIMGKLQGTLEGIPKIQSPNIPNMDLPNIPSPDLSAYAKKVESAFGALSSVVSTATKTYDRMIKKVLDAVMPIINKLQNISSMVDNLLNNDLAKCLLGITGANTGLPTPPTLGSSTLPDIKSIIGGIPLPMDLLKTALTEMNKMLDATITSAVESVMKLIEKPLCMVQSLMNELLGFKLDAGELNPCKPSKDPNNNCKPEVAQDIINESDELSAQYAKLPQSELFPKFDIESEVTETIEDFTGAVKKSVGEIQNEITRGITQVMENITKSINSSTEALDKFTRAIKQLFGSDLNEAAKTITEATDHQQGCAPSAVGALSDAIMSVI